MYLVKYFIEFIRRKYEEMRIIIYLKPAISNLFFISYIFGPSIIQVSLCISTISSSTVRTEEWIQWPYFPPSKITDYHMIVVIVIKILHLTIN